MNTKKSSELLSICNAVGARPCVLDEIDSTNEEARRQADASMPTPALIIANSQTNGRGRMGRSFHSPADTGLYLSYLAKAKPDAADTVRLTTAAAVAVSLAIEEVYGIAAEIKWVNDILINGRKVCGILCESFRAKTGDRFAVIGIGVNISTRDFPEEIRHKAASLSDSSDKKYALAAAILRALTEFYENPRDPEIIRVYKERSAVLGRRVRLVGEGGELLATATDIEDDGTLCVALDSGETRKIHSGEITLRFDNGKEI